jgi:DNA-binding MarR family transcriptional regulator
MHTIWQCLLLGNVYYCLMAPTRRPDLAAMMAPLLRELIAAEQPVLEAHGVSMWGYIVLLALDEAPMRSQAALAEAIGADKTRIIRTLDELQDLGYIERMPDPQDRRVRLLDITQSGRELKHAVQADIQRGEQRWLNMLGAADRRVFLRALEQLSRPGD